MVRLRVLFGAMFAMGLVGLGLAIGCVEKAGVVSPPVCSEDCPGYDTSAHRPRTIHVPRFKVEFAPTEIAGDIASELNEAVVRAIEKRTPYQVVETKDADMELTGIIKSFGQTCPDWNGQINTCQEIETHLEVEVMWKDLRTGENLLPRKDGSSVTSTELRSEAYYRPEIGEPIEDARRQNVEKIVDSILYLMRQSQ